MLPKAERARVLASRIGQPGRHLHEIAHGLVARQRRRQQLGVHRLAAARRGHVHDRACASDGDGLAERADHQES